MRTRTGLFLIILCISLAVLSSCSQSAEFGSDIQAFVEEGLSLVSLRAVDTAESGIDATSIKIPSGDLASFVITLNNPKNVEVIWTLVPEDPSFFETDLLFVPSSDNKTANLSFSPRVIANKNDLVFTVQTESPTLNNRRFPDQVFSIRCDSPPSVVSAIAGGIDNNTNQGMIAFCLPSLDFPDNDIISAEISWMDILAGGGLNKVVVPLGSLLTTLPSGIDNPLGTTDSLNRYWLPAQVPVGKPIGFSVVLVDDAGLKSGSLSAASQQVVCTLHYVANGGVGSSPPDQTADYGTLLTVAGAGGLTRTDYWLKGWNSTANGLGTFYAPGDSMTIVEQNATLYAVWSDEVLITVSLDLDAINHALIFSSANNPLVVDFDQNVTLGAASGSALAAGSDWHWYNNGVAAGTSSVYTLQTQTPGDQLISVTVILDGLIYSGSFRVTVRAQGEI